jgi:hypothetical protein
LISASHLAALCFRNATQRKHGGTNVLVGCRNKECAAI